MTGYHEAWGIVNAETGQLVTLDKGLFWIFDNPNEAWDSLNTTLRKPKRDGYTVRFLKIPLNWCVG